MFQRTSLDVWREEAHARKIITLIKNLDLELGGGIGTEVITEICGAPGSGKTQICLQLCLNVQFPKAVGGPSGKALFVDTNQGFNPFRLREIADNCSQRLNRTFEKTFSCETGKELFNTRNLLDNISYIYCKDYVQLLSIVQCFQEILYADIHIKLIVIDSFSFLFRSFENNTKRTRVLCEVLTYLQKLADQFCISVVITNELTTKIVCERSKIYPALGESHSHKIGQRFLLSKNKETGDFLAFIDKRYSKNKVGIPFQI